MEEEKIETPTQPAQPEPVVTQEKPLSEIGKRISFEKFWFIPVILALIALTVVGVLWMTNQKLLTPKPSPTPLPSPVVETETTISALEQQGSSDEISAIEADLEATDLSELDKELTDIEAELSSP